MSVSLTKVLLASALLASVFIFGAYSVLNNRGVYLSPESDAYSVSDQGTAQMPERSEALVALATTTIAQDYGMKDAEAQVVSSEEGMTTVSITGTSNGYFFGIMPVRVPQEVIVVEKEGTASVREVNLPWWSWFVYLN